MFVKRKLGGGGDQQPFSYLPRTWWRPEVCALFRRCFLSALWWLRWASWALWSVTVKRVKDGRSFCFCFSCHTLGCLSGKRRSNTNFGGLSTYGSSIGDWKWRTVLVWSAGPTPGEGLWWCRCPSAFALSMSSSGAAAVQELWPGEGQGGFGVVFNARVWDVHANSFSGVYYMLIHKVV